MRARSKIANHKSQITGDVAQWNQSSSLRTRWLKVRVLPSSPFWILDFGFWISRQDRQLDDSCSNPKSKIQIQNQNPLRGRLIGRMTGSEPVDRGSNPFPEARSILDFGFLILDWKQVSKRDLPLPRIQNLKSKMLKHAQPNSVEALVLEAS